MGNLPLIPCLLKIIAKTLLLFSVIFVIWFFLNLLFLHWLYFFTVLGYVPFLIIFETFPCFLFFLLWPAFLCHVFVLVVVEILWLPILEVVVGLSNVYGLSSPSVDYSCACLVVVLSFCGLISLSDWYNYYFPLLKCIQCCYRWVSQYCLDNVLLHILLQ